MAHFELKMKPKQVVKRLLSALSERAEDVLTLRFGLGKASERMTLEAIGQKYGITRERVRQVENYALAQVRKSDAYKKEKPAFDELEALIKSLGGIVAEDDVLNYVSKDRGTQNNVNFLLVLGDPFIKEKEDDEFKHRWYVDPELSKKVHESLRKLYKNLADNDLISESDIINSFLEHLKEVSEEYRDEEILKRWLGISKVIAKNPLGEWGKATSSNVKARGIRDFAFLALRKHGSPIHFREVARSIEKLFGRKAHVATTHNELIKDPRFVLVGRGLYALTEWGYVAGVVRDVIKYILNKFGALTKEEIMEKVLKERYVKENTVMVNLQNQKHFKKDKEGRYNAVS
ncbi:MAG: RNA polymerase sigma factor [Candidatus Beckwithbacteria bacterium GW2011_GWC2_47_9]|uniref:RNA polymerase sigma factor n=1 Tax=Candidatus Beckwithbacteria bacterium GW2011_GWC2_47_9 TaxID=1618373 RepID=A0A0G1W909_9BACT|nr:MAG: RNA polymerase sigma factor [Parcubacteria group bacterium GW2011_GWA2_47_21]KKU86823.1 MAG: RNA polymerase sigma factor [Candidatus Beckwithbacteria bacterium GW2011_GWC2_47_9]